MKGKSTKSALLMSFTSLLLCFAMLIGCTFAWFTDTVTSGVNRIVAGNLDVEVEYAIPAANGALGSFQKMDNTTTSLFSSNRWEPGHTEYVTLKIKNEGTLAFKYKLNVTPVTENGGINKAGKSFKLSDYLYFGTTEPVASETAPTYASRTAARDAIIAAGQYKPLSQANLTSMAQGGTLYPNNSATDPHEQYITLVVYMPESVANEANYKTGTTPPEIDLGITVVATQFEHEFDSFDNQYDKADDTNGTGAVFNPADTVVTYNYFPQVSYVAQLKRSNTKAVKDGTDAQVSETDTTITVSSEEKAEPDKPYVKATFTNTNVKSYGENEKAAVQLDAKKSDEGNFTVGTGEEAVEKEYVTYDVKVIPIIGTMEENTIFTVDLFIGEGKQNVEVTHKPSTEPMTRDEGLTIPTVAEHFIYNSDSGYVTMAVNHFSEFEATYNAPVAAVGTTAFYSVEEAAKSAGNGTVAMIRDAKEAVEVGNIKLNLNGKTITDLTVNGAADIVDGTKSGTIEKLNITGTEGAEVKVAQVETIKELTVAGAATVEVAQVETIEKLDVTGTKEVKVAQVETIKVLNVAGTASVEVANDVGEVKELSVAAGATAAVPESAVVSVTESSEGAIAYTDAEPEPAGEGEEPAESEYVAKIGTLSFKTFADAMAFAKDDNIVVLLKDVTDANVSKSVTVTSNGCGLTATVAEGAKLTVTEGTFLSFNVTGNCEITGGTFSNDPTTYVADGYIADANTDEGTWTVRQKSLAEYFAGGSGTADDPFEVETAEQFANITKASGTSLTNPVYVELTANVDLADATANKANTYGFKAVVGKAQYLSLDGNDHTVTYNGSAIGELFGDFISSTLKNVKFDINCPVTGYLDSSTFENVEVDGFMQFGNNTGVIGVYCYGATLDNVCVKANVVSSSYSAVFFGYNFGADYTLTDCSYSGNYVGPYAGLVFGNATYSRATVAINNFTLNGSIRHTNNDASAYNPLVAICSDGQWSDTTKKVLTIDGVTVSNAKGVVSTIKFNGNGGYLTGPVDGGLSISVNDDKTFKIIESEFETVDHYVVEIVANVPNKGPYGGSTNISVEETIQGDESATYKTNLKNFGFANGDAATSKLADTWDIITISGTDYYWESNPDHVCAPRGLNTQVFVRAYDANNMLVSSAILGK